MALGLLLGMLADREPDAGMLRPSRSLSEAADAARKFRRARHPEQREHRSAIALACDGRGGVLGSCLGCASRASLNTWTLPSARRSESRRARGASRTRRPSPWKLGGALCIVSNADLTVTRRRIASASDDRVLRSRMEADPHREPLPCCRCGMAFFFTAGPVQRFRPSGSASARSPLLSRHARRAPIRARRLSPCAYDPRRVAFLLTSAHRGCVLLLPPFHRASPLVLERHEPPRQPLEADGVVLA